MQACYGRFKTEAQEDKRLSIRLLGPPEVSFGEQPPLRLGTKKRLALLCYLATEGGRHPRRELAEFLWPQSEERRARTVLRSALANLRKALREGTGEGTAYGKEDRFFVVDSDLLGIEARAVELDLEALKAAVSLARTETSPGGRSIAEDPAVVGHRELIGRLEGALGLYRGEFMEGFSVEEAPEFEVWVEGERMRWRALFGELCERVSRLEGEEGLIGEAIATARLWVGHAQLEEAAHRRLVELLSSAGESERALLVYEGFENTLKRELKMEPSPSMQELAHRLREEVEERASLGASFIQPAATTPTISTQLSVLEVPLVGRQEEFGALVSEYHGTREGEARVVAVLGEPGIGKTRLAEEFLGWARARGADVLEGGASEGAGLPYGPLVEAIRPRIERERAPDDLLEDTWLSELSRLLPELKERYPDLPPPTSGEAQMAKGALFEAIARVVGTLASRAPVILFLDDLQWADATTLEVLEYAGRRWVEQGAPVLVLIAAGAEEPGDSNGAEPELKRLGERLVAETDGQPFYLVETLKALLEEEKLVVRRRADGEPVVEIGPALRVGSVFGGLLPQSVREVIRARLSRLSPVA